MNRMITRSRSSKMLPLRRQRIPPPPPPPPPPRPPAEQHPPLDPAALLRLCTVLYQQQKRPFANFQSHLQKLDFYPTHNLFIYVCNKFPASWRLVHNFYLYSKLNHNFAHTTATANKALNVYGRARNIDLVHYFLQEMSNRKILNLESLKIAITHLAADRQISKCIQALELDESFRNITVLNKIVRTLCARRFVCEARNIVFQMRRFFSFKPDEATYGMLVVGFCRAGELVEAGKVWNKMVDSGLEPGVDAYEEIVLTMFKNSRVDDAMLMFKTMRERRFRDLGSTPYGVVIDWMCKQGRVLYAFMVFAEMLKRGVDIDSAALGDLVFGLLVRRRVREAYKIVQGVYKPDVSIYHGLMKGLLRLKRANEATGVLREMIRRGCEPNMHTYIMLLQGHLGMWGSRARDPLVNFENIFVGGLVKAGETLAAAKFVERTLSDRVRVPKFDYNKFLYYFSNDEGVVMFEKVGRRLKEVGRQDLGDVLLIYGERMATRDRRIRARWDVYRKRMVP